MAERLSEILEELSKIKKYLVKVGQRRYTGKIIENKLTESQKLINLSEFEIEQIPSIDKSVFATCIEIYDTIQSVYSDIKVLCSIPEKTTSKSKMEFDLKAACDLIPVMDSTEKNTKKIIDAIEMYNDLLRDDDKPLLIKFVLKSRLSENAKLRLSTEYSAVSDLVKDLKLNLLPKKSFTAIQSRIQNSTQGWRSIDEYGTELEKLMTDLTISQAEGDSSKYSVLKPINEKMTVKQFSDGLRDTRLSTIIAARNYTLLKDAIQAARDEEIYSASTSADANVLQTPGGPQRGKYPYRGTNRLARTRGGPNFGRGQRQHNVSRRWGESSDRNYHSGNPDRVYQTNYNQRGNRGNYNQRGYYSRTFRNQYVYPIQGEEEHVENREETDPKNQSPHQFFRD